MQIVIDIPDEQIEKSLAESKSIHEDEGEKGFVNIMMLYTNGRLDFIDVSRKTDFYSCKYKILPKGHGRLIDADKLDVDYLDRAYGDNFELDCGRLYTTDVVNMIDNAPTIIEADKEVEE